MLKSLVNAHFILLLRESKRKNWKKLGLLLSSSMICCWFTRKHIKRQRHCCRCSLSLPYCDCVLCLPPSILLSRLHLFYDYGCAKQISKPRRKSRRNVQYGVGFDIQQLNFILIHCTIFMCMQTCIEQYPYAVYCFMAITTGFRLKGASPHSNNSGDSSGCS